MGRKPKEGTVKPWMQKLADKHNIDVETVRNFYESIEYIPHHGSLRKRTEEFFDLYFEEVHNNG